MSAFWHRRVMQALFMFLCEDNYDQSPKFDPVPNDLIRYSVFPSSSTLISATSAGGKAKNKKKARGGNQSINQAPNSKKQVAMSGIVFSESVPIRPGAVDRVPASAVLVKLGISLVAVGARCSLYGAQARPSPRLNQSIAF